MPSGHVHTAVNLGVLGVGAALSRWLGLDTREVALPFMAGYLLGTLLITPDLDLAGQVRINAQRNWGTWDFIWWPLGHCLKHRGITHTFFRGPALLLGYLLMLLGLVGYGADQVCTQLGWTRLSTATLPSALWPGLPGYLCAYWLHLWLDGDRPWEGRRW